MRTKPERCERAVRGALALAMVALALVGMSAGRAEAAASPSAGRSTPQLLDEAVAEVGRDTADLHLAEVFAGRGRSAKVPARFQSDLPWDGTLPLLRLRQRAAARPAGTVRARIESALATVTDCSTSTVPLLNAATSDNFYMSFGSIGGGLDSTSYLTSLEAAYAKQVTDYGWAAPPTLATQPLLPIGAKYPVRVDDTLTGGLYGFVSTRGTGAGFVGNNPNTAWDDKDAYASCMVLNNDYTGFPGSPQVALDATTAHELNHAIQFGYGAIDSAEVDDLLFEGGATWMEDEVFDGANDNYAYLWPDFRDSLGDYEGSPYETWIMLRGLTERFGTGIAGGGEQVMQDFWESISRGTGTNLRSLAMGLANKGLTLPDAYHDFAVAAGFMRTCAAGYVRPTCFEEAAGYLGAAGLPPVAGSIAATGGSYVGTIEDDYALAWVSLPTSGTYPLTLTNTSAGGQLRATAVCDTGSSLLRSPLPTVVGPGASTSLPSFSGGGCVRALAVITNQQQSPGNPASSARRSFTLGTAPLPAVTNGYWLMDRGGGIFPFGTAVHQGSTAAVALNQPMVGMAARPQGDGYWLVASDGGIFPFGAAGGHGSTGAIRLNQPIVGMAPTASGAGYWLVASDGGIFPFGDAGGYGSTGAIRLNQPIVGMAATPSGNGYWLVASDGGIFPFGDAGGYGSTGAIRLNQPMVGMAATADGRGYWLVAADGGIFPFGVAPGYGSTGGQALAAPIVEMVRLPRGDGYWLVGSNGAVYPFGAATQRGGLAGRVLSRPITGAAAARQQ